MNLKFLNYFILLSLAYLLCGCKVYYINRDVYHVNNDFLEYQKTEILTKRLKEYEFYNRNKNLNPKFVMIRNGEKYWQLDSIHFNYEKKTVNGIIKPIDLTTYFKYEDYRNRNWRTRYYSTAYEKQFAIGQAHIYIKPSEIKEGPYTINFSEIIRVEDFRKDTESNFNRKSLPYFLVTGAGLTGFIFILSEITNNGAFP